MEQYDAYVASYLKPGVEFYAPNLIPSEARERGLTYEFTAVEYDQDRVQVMLWKIPVMLHSKMCVLNNMPPDVLSLLNERRDDVGGYFIIDGKEVAVVPTYESTPSLLKKEELRNITVTVAETPIPLFIVMRAFGFISDKAIVEACFLSPEEVPLLIPCVHEAGKVFTQVGAIDYVGIVTGHAEPIEALKLLAPGTFQEKGFAIGSLARNLLRGVPCPKRVVYDFKDFTKAVPVPQTMLERRCMLRQVQGVDEPAYGYFDPFDLGQLAVSARVTLAEDVDTILLELRKCGALLERPKDLDYDSLCKLAKVIVNSRWLYSTDSPGLILHHLRLKRRKEELSAEVSIGYFFEENEVRLFCDAGRVQRPLCYGEGFDMVDENELASCLVAFDRASLTPRSTHYEVAGANCLGLVSNMIAMAPHNTAAQNMAACAHLKAAKEGGEVPLLRSEYDFGARGWNAIVGVAAYGFNSSECVIVSQGAVERGLPFCMGATVASRCGFSALCRVLPESAMPFNSQGKRLDVLVNPHSDIPIGQFWEALMGKTHLWIGESGDATSFECRPTLYLEALGLCGMHPAGNEMWYHGETGKQIECNVFVGCNYMMVVAEAKETSEGKGELWRLTRQSVEGAELEAEAVAAYGMGGVIRDAFLRDGVRMEVDAFGMWGKGLRVKVPYAFKLLSQELTAMNVQMRLVVSDDAKMRKRKRGVVKTGFMEMSHVTPSYLDNRIFDDPEPITTKIEVQRLLYGIVLESTWKSVVDTVPQLQDVVFSKYSKSTIERSLKFTFEKNKTGILVRVKNNRVAFLWLTNEEHTNDFAAKLRFGDDVDPEAFLQKVEKKLGEAAGERTRDTTKWHADGAELVAGNPSADGVAEMYDMVVNTCSQRCVGDCVFLMNREAPRLGKGWREANEVVYGNELLPEEYRNKTFLPVLSPWTTEKHLDVPCPTGEDWRRITGEKFENRVTKTESMKPWSERANTFCWRGGRSEVGEHLVKLAETIDGVDAVFVKEAPKMVMARGKDVLSVSFESEQCDAKGIAGCKFAIATCDVGAVLQGYCVLMVESKKRWWTELKGWRVGDPWREDVEVILLREDLADDLETRTGGLVKTMEWCLKNDGLCEAIAARGAKVYEARFCRSGVYDYLANVMNSVSSKQEALTKYDEKEIEAKDAELKKLWRPLKPKLTFKIIHQKDSDLNTSAVIIPFRDGKDQNRTEQLNRWVEQSQHKGLHVLVVEQSQDGQKFNRGALLNAGALFLMEVCPAIQTFVMHDVDVMFPEEFVLRYYGTDEVDVLHLGSAVAGAKTELGKVLKFSKKKFQEVNGYPNTFYGWGGEDEALALRLGDAPVFRPKEKNVGEEMKTTNDIKDGHLTGSKELFVYENALLDSLQWQQSGFNSLQFAVVKHVEMGTKKVRRITVKLTPFEREESKPVAEKIEETDEIKEIEEKIEGTEDTVEEKEDEKKDEPKTAEVEEVDPEEIDLGIIEVEVEPKIIILGKEPPVLTDVPTMTNTDSLDNTENTIKVIQLN